MLPAEIVPDIRPEVNRATTTKVVLIVEYEGTRYHGFQLQAGLPTVQSEMEAAIEKLTGEKRRLITASRTDTGVHAKGQVVSFRTGASHSPETFVKGMNYYLPKDIAVKAAYKVSDNFNIRRLATSREYHYSILNSSTRSPIMGRFCYQVGGGLDIEAMNQAAKALIGEHDFASFVNDSKEAALKTTVRRVYQAEVCRDGEEVTFKMVARSFLIHQVRNTIGALLRVGQGRMSVDEFHSILEARKPGLAGPMAPACGLCLVQVNYEQPLG